MKMNKEKGNRFNSTGKNLESYTEERRLEDQDIALAKKVLKESSPRAVMEFSKSERMEKIISQRQGTEKKKETPFEKDTTILEKRFLLFCNKLKNDPANLFRRLKQSTINLTNMIQCLTFDRKIDIKSWKYRRNPFEKVILRMIWRINKHKSDKKLFHKEWIEKLLALYDFRENSLLPKINELQIKLIKNKTDVILESPREHIFFKGSKIIIEKIEEKLKGPRRFNSTLIEYEAQKVRQLF